MSALDAAMIEYELTRSGALLGRPLSVAEQTGSTNDDARQAALAGAPHGATFLADGQAAGRGRGGRLWHSPPGENLYLSVVLRPRLPARSVAPLHLVAGLAVASIIERCVASVPSLSTFDVRLKWPNDVLVRGRKVAGVLIEGQLRGDAVSSLIVGIGLNVHTRHFPPELEVRATSLALMGCVDVSRELLAAELLVALGDVFARFEADQLAPFLQDLVRLDWLRGREVNVSGVTGVASGIDMDGHLLVRVADGVVRAVAAGEVSIAPG